MLILIGVDDGAVGQNNFKVDDIITYEIMVSE